MTFHIVLYQPEIPPNTGNVIRLAANTGSTLTLVEPLGFDLSDAKLKRAGLDYREFVNVKVCENLTEALEPHDHERCFALSTKGVVNYTDIQYQAEDVFVFGPETRGLPDTVRSNFGNNCARIPMESTSRSLNLSNAVAIVVYEAWRQIGFGEVN